MVLTIREALGCAEVLSHLQPSADKLANLKKALLL